MQRDQEIEAHLHLVRQYAHLRKVFYNLRLCERRLYEVEREQDKHLPEVLFSVVVARKRRVEKVHLKDAQQARQVARRSTYFSV